MNLLGPYIMDISWIFSVSIELNFGWKTSNNILRFHGKKVHFLMASLVELVSPIVNLLLYLYTYIYYSSVVLWSEKCCGNSGSRVIVPQRDFSVFILTFSYLYIRRIFFVGKKKNHNSFPVKIKRIRCGNRKK